MLESDLQLDLSSVTWNCGILGKLHYFLVLHWWNEMHGMDRRISLQKQHQGPWVSGSQLFALYSNSFHFCLVHSYISYRNRWKNSFFYFLVLLVLSLRSWYFLCHWLIVSFEKCAKSSLLYSILLKIQTLLSHVIFMAIGQLSAFTPYVSLSFGYLSTFVALQLLFSQYWWRLRVRIQRWARTTAIWRRRINLLTQAAKEINNPLFTSFVLLINGTMKSLPNTRLDILMSTPMVFMENKMWKPKKGSKETLDNLEAKVTLSCEKMEMSRKCPTLLAFQLHLETLSWNSSEAVLQWWSGWRISWGYIALPTWLVARLSWHMLFYFYGDILSN